jgi:lipocalin-like protein
LEKRRICVSVLGSLILASICSAQTGKDKKETRGPTAKTQIAKAKSAITRKFIGTWKLVAIEGQQRRDRVGLIMYDTTGHMTAQIMPLDRPKFASGNRQQATQEELKAALDGYIAYFGPYEVNEAEGVVIHHLEASIIPNQVGSDNIRYYEFSGDRLTLIPTNMVDGKLTPKSSARIRLIWERVK